LVSKCSKSPKKNTRKAAYATGNATLETTSIVFATLIGFSSTRLERLQQCQK